MANLMALDFRPDTVFESVLNNGDSRMTLVSLDVGQAIDTHRAPVPVVVVVLSGEIRFPVESQEFLLKPGEALRLEPHEAHALSAVSRSTVLVTRLAPSTKEPRRAVRNAEQKEEQFHLHDHPDMMASIAPELKSLVEEHAGLWQALKGIYESYDLEQYAKTLKLIGEELDHHFVFEETILFPRVARLIGGADVGPIAMLTNEHKKIRKMYEPCVQLLELASTNANAGTQLKTQVHALATILWQHVEKEDKFIFPMASRILSKEDLTAIEEDLSSAARS